MDLTEFKTTYPSNLKDRIAIRWTHNHTRMSGWDIIWRLAFKANLGTYDFIAEYSPFVYDSHIELKTIAWDTLKAAA